MRRLLSVALVLTLLVGGGFTAFDHLAPQESAQLAAELEHALSKLERKSVMVDGLEVVYLEGGSGEPLVLVHGFGADKDNFTRVARGLTSHYRVIIPDLPGFGESSRPVAASFHISEQSERVHRFVATLGIDTAHFGGSSMGGWIVADHAARYPQQTLSLWLLAPGGVSSADPSPMQKAYTVTGVSPLIAQSPGDFERIIDLVMADPPYMPYSMKRVLGERAARDAKLHTEIFEQIVKDDSLEQLATRIIAPSLIVWGQQDQVLDVSGAHILQQALKGAQLIVMPDVGHLPMLEKPKQAAADYLHFRASLLSQP